MLAGSSGSSLVLTGCLAGRLQPGACQLRVGLDPLFAKMAERGHGVIGNVIGNAGDQPPAEYAAGVSADAMLEVLTRTVGSESLNAGVRVVGVSPADVLTVDGGVSARRAVM